MRLMKWKDIGRGGYALVLAAGLLFPGISNAAVVTGQTSVSLPNVGDVSLAMTVDDVMTEITIMWPENRWVGISFGPAPSHDGSYVIVSSLDGTDVYEANQRITRPGPPVRQAQQDLTVDSFSTGGGVSELTVTRLSDTGDSQDFIFTAVPQVIEVQYALGWEGDDPIYQHEIRGYFPTIELAVIPVPAALPLLASGLFALGLIARRKKAA